MADFFERVDDERFDLLTIIDVEVDSDLNRAQVFVTTLGSVVNTGVSPGSTVGHDFDVDDVDADVLLLEALADYRKAVRRKIGSEARIRKTPDVVFAIDPGVRSGARIEQILAGIDIQSDVSGAGDEHDAAGHEEGR